MADNDVRSTTASDAAWPAAVWELGVDDDDESGADAMLDRLAASPYGRTS